MLQQITPTQAKAAERHRSFHASISARAARVGVIPLAPFVPKQHAINPTPYWHQMWFFDLVTFGETYVPGKTAPRLRDAKGIQKVVADYYGVKLSDILSSRRTKEVIKPRHVAMYLVKELTDKSLPEIGRRFAGRDHTTVLSAVRKIDRLFNTDQAIQNDVKRLMARLA